MNTGSNTSGKLVSMRLIADTQLNTQETLYLSYDKEYAVITGCPSKLEELIENGFSDKAVSVALISFKKYAKKNITENIIKFSKGNAMKYNISNGIIAIYTYDGINITKPSIIWEDNLKKLGYVRDENLQVPFTKKEAYYDKFRDELQFIC